uniref:Tetraspanin 13 n=1 Tax=Prolemur simus TaxID=1328070 RepID=A0A8C9A3F8_PROSS
MVCGGFACSKNCLCALNLLYTLVSLLLIGIAAWGIGFGLISSLRVVGVVIAVGIFLFLIALVGLIGAVKHHQVLLFFYMIILLLVFIVQFSVSCACLALNQDQQGQLLEVGWNNTASARNDIQRNLNCCGFRNFNPNDTCLASCIKSGHPCAPCAPIIGEYAGEVLRFVGGIGLFFSFTEVCEIAQYFSSFVTGIPVLYGKRAWHLTLIFGMFQWIFSLRISIVKGRTLAWHQKMHKSKANLRTG